MSNNIAVETLLKQRQQHTEVISETRYDDENPDYIKQSQEEL